MIVVSDLLPHQRLLSSQLLQKLGGLALRLGDLSSGLTLRLPGGLTLRFGGLALRLVNLSSSLALNLGHLSSGLALRFSLALYLIGHGSGLPLCFEQPGAARRPPGAARRQPGAARQQSVPPTPTACRCASATWRCAAASCSCTSGPPSLVIAQQNPFEVQTRNQQNKAKQYNFKRCRREGHVAGVCPGRAITPVHLRITL
jgi:hypothetical protein